jgi:hypothetical protein
MCKKDFLIASMQLLAKTTVLTETTSPGSARAAKSRVVSPKSRLT